MSFIRIDKDKCKRDGVCVAECPERVIQISGDDGFPSPTEFADRLCIQCGHCVAVCPEGAFSLDIMKSEECSPIQKELSIPLERIEQHICSRRSIRTYKKKRVERNVLKHLIDIARYGPTAKNFQPVHWLVVEDPDETDRLGSMVIEWMRAMLKGESKAIITQFMLEQIVGDWEKGGDWICRGAPHMIVTHGPKKTDIPLVDTDCTIALTTLELAAPAFGLGACWGGYFNTATNNWPPLAEALGMPENHAAFGAMMVGYPVYQYHRIPLRKQAPITWR